MDVSPNARQAERRKVRPDMWAATTAYITDDAAEVVELSDLGQRLQIVDDPDAADIRVRVHGMPADEARSAAREFMESDERLRARQQITESLDAN